jgi:nucleoside-diphosphate-sugar epimerase
MRILITGSHGFVGRHFCRRLLNEGHTVVGIDNMVSGKPHEEWMFQPGDKKNFQQLYSDCRAFFAARISDQWGPHTFDLIIHCAAVVGGRLTIDGDPLAVATDLAIDAELFNWVVRTKKKTRVIYFSSSAAYPAHIQRDEWHFALQENMINFEEDELGRPDMTYGWAKLSGEYLAQFAVKQYGLPVVIYRPFGGYGEDQALSYPFPAIIDRVVKQHDPVMVWGSGDQERDFIHINDVVDCVLDTYMKLPAGDVLNIGTGQAVSFFQLAELVVRIAGIDVAVRNDPLKPEGVFSRIADVTKMRKFYEPRITLEEGVRRALRRATDGRSKAVD